MDKDKIFSYFKDFVQVLIKNTLRNSSSGIAKKFYLNFQKETNYLFL